MEEGRTLQYYIDNKQELTDVILKEGIRSLFELSKVLSLPLNEIMKEYHKNSEFNDTVESAFQAVDKALFDRQREDYVLALEKRRELIQQGNVHAINAAIKDYQTALMNSLLIEEKRLGNELLRKELSGELMEEQILFINNVTKDSE